MESLIIEFTNKCVCFYSLFKSGGLETKDNYLGRRVEKSLRTVGLE